MPFPYDGLDGSEICELCWNGFKHSKSIYCITCLKGLYLEARGWFCNALVDVRDEYNLMTGKTFAQAYEKGRWLHHTDHSTEYSFEEAWNKLLVDMYKDPKWIPEF